VCSPATISIGIVLYLISMMDRSTRFVSLK
jgi:hypothetical protein